MTSSLALGSVLAVGVGLSLGLLGGGGSILTLPILLYVVGQPEEVAVPTSLVVVGVTSAAGLMPHARAGNVEWRTGLSFAAAGALGAFPGGWAAQFLPGKLLLAVFVGVMVLASAAMLRPRPTDPPGGQPSGKPPPSLPRILLVGASAGAMTGLVGAGGGFVVVPALTLFGGLDVRRAVATSLLVISLNTAAGFVGHATHASIDPVAAVAVTGAAVVGSLAGAAGSQRVPKEALRKAFAVLVLAMAGLMTWKSLL